MIEPNDDMTEADYARDELDHLEVVEFTFDPDVRSVVSVRFNRGELKRIEQAASKAGMPLSTYIRNATLAASETVDLEAAREALMASHRKLKEAIAALGKDSQPPAAA